MLATPATPPRWDLIGTVGYLSCLLFSIALAVLAQGWHLALVFGVAIALAAVFYPAGLDTLRRPWVWILAVLLVIPSMFFGETDDTTLVNITFSPLGLGAGMAMALRAMTILI